MFLFNWLDRHMKKSTYKVLIFKLMTAPGDVRHKKITKGDVFPLNVTFK